MEDVEGSGDAPLQPSVEPRVRQRRRLVGRGCLPLSPFLDTAWTMREEQRVQLQQRLESKSKERGNGKDGEAIPKGMRGGEWARLR